jgi:hypothetical protein
VPVPGLLIGYARGSADTRDLTAQRDALTALGVERERIYVDHGLTGTNRARPGLREALAACRAGDTLVVTKLDRVARSVLDAPSHRRRGPSLHQAVRPRRRGLLDPPVEIARPSPRRRRAMPRRGATRYRPTGEP